MIRDKIEETIQQYRLILPGERIGVAVSGGVDSMVLLHVLENLASRLEFSLVVLHFEHGIRGAESLRDMEFVKKQCALRQLPLAVGRGNVPGEVRETGESPEAVARRQRYAFFHEQKREQKLDKIAVAHHKDDGAETFLLNLIRGSGISGLTSMKIRRDPGIIRPMMEVTREEILEYARRNNVAFMEDSSNASAEYSRNYVRSEILPRMAKLNPAVSQAIMRASELLLEEDAALDTYTDLEYTRCVQEMGTSLLIDLAVFNALSLAIKRRVIRKGLSHRYSLIDVDKNAVDRMIELARTGKTGKYFALQGKFFARVSYNALIISDKMYTIERNGSFSLRETGPTELWPGEMLFREPVEPPRQFPEKSSLVQFVNGEALEGAEIRTRREGDRFSPFGVHGSKKLKDWMIDRKIPAEMRDGIPLLARDGEVLWVIGYGLSEKLRVGENAAAAERLCYIFNHGGNEEDGKARHADGY